MNKANKAIYWKISLVVLLLIIGMVIWWFVFDSKKDPLNKHDAFLSSQDGNLYWFELSNHNGKVSGFYHEQLFIEERGYYLNLEEKKHHVIGEKTSKGYELTVDEDNPLIFEIQVKDDQLFVNEKGTQEYITYKPIDEKKLQKYIKKQQQQLELANEEAEEKEKNRLDNFFANLANVYGYSYTSEDQKLQLFITIDESLLEGELSGTLQMMEVSGPYDNILKETTYEINGITDGIMVEFFTTVDGNDKKLAGEFHPDATGIDITFWKTEQKLSFHEITEDEYEQKYEQFKK